MIVIRTDVLTLNLEINNMKLGFELLKQGDASGEGWIERANHENPYGKEELLNASVDANEPLIDNILSIPSPYARMHVTETAFIEGKARKFKDLAPAYKRAISHCLDVFEMLFIRDGVQLADENIRVRKYKYQHPDTTSMLSGNIATYLSALELFRKNYGSNKFVNFYCITKNIADVEYLIAMTSPFTVFFTPEDMDLSCQIKVSNPNRVLFAHSEKDKTETQQWFGIEDRSKSFQRFMYALILKYSGNFKVLFDYLETRVDENIRNEVTNNGGRDYFGLKFSSFTINEHTGVPIHVDADLGRPVEILPLGYDTFVFENFLKTQRALDYSKVEDSTSDYYKTPILERKNIFLNSENPESLAWITIHDLLEDDVFITTNHVDDEKYLSVPDNDKDVDAILPFKKLFFQLFNLYDDFGKLLSTDELQKWISVRYETEIPLGEDALFSDLKRKLYITLSLPIEGGNGVKVSLTKIYDSSHIHPLDIDFGIYPFHQVTKISSSEDGPDNFYRLMLYLTGNRLIDIESDWVLYAKDSKTNLLIDNNIAVNETGKFHVQRHSTITEENYQGIIRDNLYYLSLESRYLTNHDLSNYRDVRFNFVEITVNGIKMLIVPRFDIKNLNVTHSNSIAIDLGTSNTYVAYGDGANCRTFEDDNYNRLVGKLCYQESPKSYDITQGGLHQYTEFIPTEFGEQEYQAKFPVQTIQLYQKLVVNDDELNKSEYAQNGAPFVSMYTMNIPFLYAKKGCRSIGNTDVDSRITNFKWFSTTPGELRERNAFRLYVDQLCFMMRNKFIYKNFDLSSVKLVWTYPLALSDVDVFRTEWECAYRKYFCDDYNNKIFHFTESETPMEMAPFADNQNGIKVGIDIGGGTSDVIIYEPIQDHQGNTVNRPTLATSFSFAGNVMFGKISGRGAVMANRSNVWFRLMRPFVAEEDAGITGQGVKSRIVDIDESNNNVTEFMDYIFTHGMNNPAQAIAVRQGMNQSPLLFISLMHISALLWEIAQVCKLKLNGKFPTNIVLSGNGSKLILMSQKGDKNRKDLIKQLMNGIFSTVYGKNSLNRIEVELLKEPKRATANGALKLASKNVRDSVVADNYYIPFDGKIHHKNNNMLDMDNNSCGGVTFDKPTQNDEVSNAFGGIFNFDEPKDKQQPVDNKEKTFEEEDSSLLTEAISTKWKRIAKQVGDFLDFYFKLAGAPLGGNISPNGVLTIREYILGSRNSYETEQMLELIERAKKTIENNILVMSNGHVGNMTINESVFLSVMAQFIAEVIKFFGEQPDTNKDK